MGQGTGKSGIVVIWDRKGTFMACTAWYGGTGLSSGTQSSSPAAWHMHCNRPPCLISHCLLPPTLSFSGGGAKAGLTCALAACSSSSMPAGGKAGRALGEPPVRVGRCRVQGWRRSPASAFASQRTAFRLVGRLTQLGRTHRYEKMKQATCAEHTHMGN
jgi:hypothetical protein